MMKKLLFSAIATIFMSAIGCNNQQPSVENTPIKLVTNDTAQTVSQQDTSSTKPTLNQDVKPAPVTENKTPEKTVHSGPKVSFENPKFYFGTVTQGDKVTHIFKVTNTGNAPLEILNTTASCGCTQPSFNFLPIMPGNSSKIKVVFDTEHKEGNQLATVNVTTNANPKEYKIYLEGVVVTVEN